MLGLSVGMAISLGLAMISILTGISIMWFMIPCYAIALGLSFFVPKLFTSIAFDLGRRRFRTDDGDLPASVRHLVHAEASVAMC